MSKKILEGVSAMWYGNPSAVCYTGSVMRLLEYIGDPAREDEIFALSGVGLCFPWKPDSCCDEVSVIPEIPERTMSAFGYESEYLNGRERTKEFYLGKIKASIDANRPVIGFGITTSEPYSCLIVGYGDSGLYTRAFWSPSGEPHDSEEYFYCENWYDNCSGILVVGDKTGERLTGRAAYKHITDLALFYRITDNKTVSEHDIPINRAAFPAMHDWLLNDSKWATDEQVRANEVWLKQSGLLLFNYYRNNLYSYLWNLNTMLPGVVNPPALLELERISRLFPDAEKSDLHLGEIPGLEAVTDFSKLRDASLRRLVAGYVMELSDCDSSLQWTLFMPDFVRDRLDGFEVSNFEYRDYPAMRFIGFEGEEYADIALRKKAMQRLDEMTEYRSGFDYDLLFMHHYGLEADNPWHGVWGRFMKAGAPVPEGYLHFDFEPVDNGIPGAPFLSQFAYATFSGDMEAMHKTEGFDSDAMYDTTRNIILGDGVNIPYPQKYWTAEVFPDGCDNWSTAYLFSTGAREFPRGG